MIRICFLILTIFFSEASIAKNKYLRDIESYAIASCFYMQENGYLKTQGDSWASAIIQRMKGNVEHLKNVYSAVEKENSKRNFPIAHTEDFSKNEQVLLLMYCNEMIDRPKVRESIKNAEKIFRKN